LQGDVPSNLKVAGHVFGTRFAHESGALFFELAENRHSQILDWHDNKLHYWTPADINCIAPAPGSDGKKMVAICNGALYYFSAPGQGRPILSPEGEIADPDLSPDGSQVAFSWRRNGQWGIYQTDLAGSKPKRLTKGNYNDRWPRYSPDGAWLAFSRQDPTADIWVIERKSERELRITHDPGNDTEPAWSDDIKTMYFVSDRDRAIHQGSLYQIALPFTLTESGSVKDSRSTTPRP
jgi:Tol biopolymer transport system component